MTQDEIRKLLGGYATGALTADERRMLFEAALGDQELFNALQNEDALKELLDDPVSRDQLRRVLATLGRDTARAPFSWRRWVYGVALPAVVAVIVIVVMNRANAPQQIPPSPASAPPQIVAREVAPQVEGAPKSEAAPAPVKKQTSAPKALRVVPAPPSLQLESARVARPNLAAPTVAALRAPVSPPIPTAVRQQFSSNVVTTAPLYQGPLVRYSLVRTDQAVRVQVTSGIAGYLALYQVDASGNSRRVYPSGNNDVAGPVSPNQPIEIPSEPLKLADAGAKLRLVLVPAPPAAVTGSLGGAVGGLVNDATLPIQAPLTPLVVDIPLGPN
jgi:hypothetical protein